VHEHVCWFFQQCLGILSTLNSLHNLHSSYTAQIGKQILRCIVNERHGRHSDIKPKNILWFKNYRQQRDHLVIADLGLAEFHTTQSKSQSPWAGVGGYTQTYKAPESEVDGYIGPRYDIWALGCVFLEHASVFLRRDSKCIEEFSDKRLKEEQELPRQQNYSSDTFYYLENDDDGNADFRTPYQGLRQAKVKGTVTKVSWRLDTMVPSS
jgi:serine/threonine protein kinase